MEENILKLGGAVYDAALETGGAMVDAAPTAALMAEDTAAVTAQDAEDEALATLDVENTAQLLRTQKMQWLLFWTLMMLHLLLL